MNTGSLSVIVTSYNYEKYIGETLSSLVNQTVNNFEIIIVDDGSTDNSIVLIKDYCRQYPNIKFYQHEGGGNQGLPASIRLGIEKATGKYIAFCESDDYWDSSHVGKLLEYIANNNEAVLIFNFVKVVNQLSDETMNVYANKCNEFLKENHEKKIFLSLINNYMPTFSAACIRKDLLLSVDLNTYHSQYVDFWIWRQLCLKYPIHFLENVVTYWRRHDESYDYKENVDDITDFLFSNNKLLIKSVSYGFMDRLKVFLFRCLHRSRLKIIEYEMRHIYKSVK